MKKWILFSGMTILMTAICSASADEVTPDAIKMGTCGIAKTIAFGSFNTVIFRIKHDNSSEEDIVIQQLGNGSKNSQALSKDQLDRVTVQFSEAKKVGGKVCFTTRRGEWGPVGRDELFIVTFP